MVIEYVYAMMVFRSARGCASETVQRKRRARSAARPPAMQPREVTAGRTPSSRERRGQAHLRHVEATRRRVERRGAAVLHRAAAAATWRPAALVITQGASAGPLAHAP